MATTTAQLSSFLADGGTVTFAYPAGTSAASFPTANGHVLKDRGTKWFSPREFTVVFGVSNITVTYNGGETIPKGTTLTLDLDAVEDQGDALKVDIGDGGGPVALDERLKRIAEVQVNIKDRRFGAVPNTDSSDAIQAAIDYVGGLGGGTVVVPGHRFYAKGLTPKSNVLLKGVSRGTSRLMIPDGDDDANSIFLYTTETPLESVSFEDLTFEGQWEAFPSLFAGNGLVTLKFITDLRFLRCRFKNSRHFGLNINECADVTVDDCRFRYAVRDFCAIWATPDVTITKCRFNGNDDDSVSINWENGATLTEPVRLSISVTHNHFKDCGPVRTQAPKGVQITHNIMHRMRGNGINLSVGNTENAKFSTGHSNIVAFNTILDVIGRQWFVDGGSGSVNNRVYIQIETVVPQTGGLDAAPGDLFGGEVFEPYGYNYDFATTSGNVGAARMPHGTIVTRNICRRTLPAVTNYSDWGFGEAYGKEGTLDYDVTDTDMSCIGVRVVLPQADLYIDDNLIQGVYSGIWFTPKSGVTVADRLARRVRVRRNTVSDFSLHGFNWDFSTPVTHQDISIEDNEFDGDPNFTHAERGANGTWVDAPTPVALSTPYLASAYIARNRIKNVSRVVLQTSVTTLQNIEGNIQICDPAAVGYSASNKGIGTILAVAGGEQWWLHAEDSDPESATYGNTLGANPRNTAGVPSTGKWLAGTMVRARGTLGTDKTVQNFFLRLTTGTEHVSNTDWSTQLSLPGTLLNAYADDAGASAGGIGIGGYYSASGVVRQRRT